MASLAGGGTGRQVALGDDLAVDQPLEDRQLAILPVGVPLTIVEEVILAVGGELLEDLPLRRQVEREVRKGLVGKLLGRGSRPPHHRERTLDVQSCLDRARLAFLGAIHLEPIDQARRAVKRQESVACDRPRPPRADPSTSPLNRIRAVASSSCSTAASRVVRLTTS